MSAKLSPIIDFIPHLIRAWGACSLLEPHPKLLFTISIEAFLFSSRSKGCLYLGIERDKNYFKAAQNRVKKTKIIEDDNLDTIENNKSKPRVAFGSLVELGILKPGTILWDFKKEINAKIMVDGSIKYKESEGSIHKVAAKIMGTESCNGWTYWHYYDGKSTVLIDNLRQRFISKNLSINFT